MQMVLGDGSDGEELAAVGFTWSRERKKVKRRGGARACTQRGGGEATGDEGGCACRGGGEGERGRGDEDGEVGCG